LGSFCLRPRGPLSASSDAFFRFFARERYLLILDEPKPDDQSSAFIALNHLPLSSSVSAAIDVTGFTPDRSCIPSKESDYSVVISAQALDRPFNSLPLHVIQGKSRQANSEVRAMISAVCEDLTNRGIVLKYLCTDGDRGSYDPHKQFFAEGHLAFLDDGLPEALASISNGRISRSEISCGFGKLSATDSGTIVFR
jgi:hypothetical protein